MIPESLQLLSKAFPTTQQKESYLTNLSSKQTYSTLFTLPTTGTLTAAFDKDMLPCRFSAFGFLIKIKSFYGCLNCMCRLKIFCAVE